MSAFVRALLLALVLAVGAPAAAWAGMPSITLTDVARMRVQTMSFFLMGLLASALCVKLLWNYLRRDFTSLPRLSYGRALAVVVLWGFLFGLVLTMISGARELMTPGAWEKQGLTYRLAKAPEQPPKPTKEERERHAKLDRLRAALWSYAQSHGGQFPAGQASKEIATDLWEASRSPPLRYLYVPGQQADCGALPLVYEPGIHGDQRLVLLTSGDIKTMSLEEILQALPPEKP